MSGLDETQAYSILGLAPGASQTQVDAAHERLVGFFNTEQPEIKMLADSVRVEIESAYKLVSSKKEDTVSDTTKKPTPHPSKGGGGWIFAVIAIVAAGVIYEQSQKKQEPPAPSPGPSPGQDQPVAPVTIQPPAPQGPPQEVAPFIHNDDLKDTAVRWTAGWQTVDSAPRYVAWGYAQNGDPVYRIDLYQDNGTWREWRLYQCRYSNDRNQVAVQRFAESGIEYKDQRNVSTVGDVLVQTTIYRYTLGGKLDSAQVDTPFTQASRSLRINRYGMNVTATELPGGTPVAIGGGSSWLGRIYDLWDVFGAPNI